MAEYLCLWHVGYKRDLICRSPIIMSSGSLTHQVNAFFMWLLGHRWRTNRNLEINRLFIPVQHDWLAKLYLFTG